MNHKDVAKSVSETVRTIIQHESPITVLNMLQRANIMRLSATMKDEADVIAEITRNIENTRVTNEVI